jgi:hypothetical protein
MATILDLFKTNQSDIYGKVDNIRINSRGLINPPRGAALLLSSPNTIADLIGNQVSGVLKGSATRPSDTIFSNNTPFSKPISLGKTRAGLQNVIEANTNYFIKDNPSPASVIAKITQGASTTEGIGANLAIGAINKFGSKKGFEDLKNYKNNLLKKRGDETYGAMLTKNGESTGVKTEDKKFSQYYRTYEIDRITKKVIEGDKGLLKLRKGSTLPTWDNVNTNILNKSHFKDTKEYSNEISANKNAGNVYVTFKKYGKNEIVPFVGTISGISEDITPEWSAFKYIGSPFNIYRYGGVERSIKFDLKLYYTTISERDVMIKKINYLKSLAFPYDEVSTIKYNDSETTLAFSPNLVYMGISGLYNDVLGYVESLSFNIEETVSWSNVNPNMEDVGFATIGDDTIYPSLINVSFGMKIIENHTTEVKDTVTRYRYDFDGYGYDGITETNKAKSIKISQTNTPFSTPKTLKNVNLI